MTRSTPFEAAHYETQVPSRASANVVVARVMELLPGASVVDFGCGTGAWLAAFIAAGVTDAVGVEGGHPRDDQLLVPREIIRHFDLQQPVDLGRQFDLAVSVEVGEHLAPGSIEIYVDSISRHADAVVFSAAVPGQSGAFHLNEQWPAYWCDRFADRSYVCFDPFRSDLWEDDRVAWWYRQNLLLFARGEAANTLKRSGLTSRRPLPLVHPALLEQVLAELWRPRGMREHARGFADALRRRLSR